MSNFVVRHVQPDDYRAAGLLYVQVEFDDNHTRQQAFDYWTNRQPHEPGFDYARHRIGVLDGQVVSYAIVRPYTLRYGMVKLRVAGIGDVCTHPDYRGQGYASAVLQDSLAYMAEQGVHLALLNGIPGFYERFGFSAVWPEYVIEVASAQAAALQPALALRAAIPQDAPQIARLYRAHWEGRITFTRAPEIWLWRIIEEYWFDVRVVEDAQGRICGYIAHDDLSGGAVEVVADTPDAAVTLLAEIGRLFLAAGLETSRWFMPPDDAIISFARQLMPVTVSARYQPSGGWMARLIDTRGLVDKLLPEIIAQARATRPDFDADALHFDCQPDRVALGLRGHDTTVCRLNHQDFIQVVFGSLRPAALALRPHSRLHPDGVQLLELLFPPRMAALGCWDWF
jgi:predicted N-acetyltransferase YhbS